MGCSSIYTLHFIQWYHSILTVSHKLTIGYNAERASNKTPDTNVYGASYQPLLHFVILQWRALHCPHPNFDLLSLHKLEQFALKFSPVAKQWPLSGEPVMFNMSEIHIGLVRFVSPQQQVFHLGWWLDLNVLGQKTPEETALTSEHAYMLEKSLGEHAYLSHIWILEIHIRKHSLFQNTRNSLERKIIWY